MKDGKFYTTDLVQRLADLSSNDSTSIAAYFGHTTLTYRRLDDESSRISSALRKLGTKKGDVVGVCLPPGFDILKAIFAIFKLGAVYMPLNPDHPRNHIDLILEESRPSCLVTWQSVAEQCLPNSQCLCLLDDLSSEGVGYDSSLQVVADDPAYLMFTSGTTGRPKGVLLSNRNLSHFIGEAYRLIDVNSDDVFCNLARFTFSISLFDLLTPICFGASLRFVKRENILDLEALIRELKASTVLHAGPTLLSALFQYLTESGRFSELTHMKHVSTGGDIVLPFVMESMKRFFSTAELFVFYGCTEIACMGTYFKFGDATHSGKNNSICAFNAPIDCTYVGVPFPEMQLVLLNDEGSRVVEGDVGEICFSGDGLALEYLNQLELTRERFCGFQSTSEDSTVLKSERIYRTGDFGRFSSQGVLQILGRRDFQVQMRGVRIELAAIENRIIDLGLTSHCVVVKRPLNAPRQLQSAKDRYAYENAQADVLFAFLVSPKDATSKKNSSEIAEILAQYLPLEMIPSAFQYIEKLPTNFNGKLDRKQLQTMDVSSSEKHDSHFIPIEDAIASVFRNQLQIDSLGRHDNFFAMGGHSLMAILLVSKLKIEHQIDLSVADFFENPSIAGIAEVVEARMQEKGAVREIERLDCAILKLSEIAPHKPKLFVLAGANIFSDLAKALEADWSVYGLVSEKEIFPVDLKKQAQGFSIEDLSSDYFAAMTAEQSSGPYYILAHSFGGIVAYDLAKLLESRNHSIGKLILLDPLLPEWANPLRFRIMQFFRIFRTPPSELWSFCAIRLRKRRLTSKIKANLLRTTQVEAQLVDLRSLTSYSGVLAEMDEVRVRTKQQAAVAYMKKIKPSFDDAILFLSKVRQRNNPLHSKTLTWDKYIRKMRVVWLDVSHEEMIKDPKALAKIRQEIKCQ